VSALNAGRTYFGAREGRLAFIAKRPKLPGHFVVKRLSQAHCLQVLIQ